MKVLVFSDSHGELSFMRDVIRQERPDQIFHLGDHDRDAEDLAGEFPTIPIAAVQGNCDYYSDAPLTRVITLRGSRFFLCHGHTFGVKTSYLRASYAALEQKADFLLCGHTHEPYLEQNDRTFLTIMNPGSCGFSYPTYGRILLEPGKLPEATLIYPDMR